MTPDLRQAVERARQKLKQRRRLAEMSARSVRADHATAVQERLEHATVEVGYADLRLILSALKGEGWQPTHRHVKRGTDYQIIGTALLQSERRIGEGALLTIYRANDELLWARPEGEFNDGRFEALPETPQP